MERYLKVFLPINLFSAIRNTAVLRHFVYRTNTFGPYDLVSVQLAPAFTGWRPFWNKVYCNFYVNCNIFMISNGNRTECNSYD